MIPVSDLLCESLFYCRLSFCDQRKLGAPNFLEMLRHNLCDGVTKRLVLQISIDPAALRSTENCVDARLACGHGSIVKVRSVLDVSRAAVGAEFNVEHPLGNYATLA